MPDAVIDKYLSGDELIASGSKPDILFLDIQMPGMDGMETAKMLRQDNENMILIFVTAAEEYVFQAFDVGAFHYLVKPFSDEKLKEVVTKAVHNIKRSSRLEKDEKYIMDERFWSEVVNTACHAINRLYLHRFLKKTSYELLTDNKPNVSYFRVFGSKCDILVKKGRHSKFAPKVVEGFLLGYDSNTIKNSKV